MKKIVRLTESELVRLVKRALNEQSASEFGKSVSEPMDTYDDVDISDQMDDRNTEITKSQLEDIIDNFSTINCDGISHFNEMDLYGKRPEHEIIYCLYYKGKSRADLMKKYKSL